MASAEPISQASACPHRLVWTWSRRKPTGRASATRNQMLSRSAATNRCRPYFTASPASKVTTRPASTTSPQAPSPMP
jgi:hypothetical protein